MGNLIFDGFIEFKNEDNIVLSSLEIRKSSLSLSVSYDSLEKIVLNHFIEDGIVEFNEFVDNTKLHFVCIFNKKTTSGKIFFYCIAHHVNYPIDDEIFDIFNSVGNVCIVLYGDSGKIIFANDHFYKTIGYSKDEVLGKHICDFIVGIHKEVCYHHVKERSKGVKFNSIYHGVKVLSKKGENRIFSVYGNTVIYNSKPAGILFGVDITQESNLKKLYMALKEVNNAIMYSINEHELFNRVCNLMVKVGFASAVVATVDNDFKIKVEHVCGDGSEFFKNVKASVNGVSSYGKGTAAKAFKEGKIIINPDTETNPDMEFWRDDLLKLGFYSNCAVPIAVDGRIRYILLVFSRKKNAFVSEYIDLLRELKNNIEFGLSKISKDRNIKLINSVFDKIDECVVITDEDCRIEYVNNAFVRSFGFKFEDIRGKTPLFFSVEGEKEDCKSTEIYKELVRRGSVNFEYDLKTVANKVKTWSVSVVPVYKGDKIHKFIGLMRDITSQKEYQRELENLNKFYKTLYSLNEIFVNSENEDELLKKTCSVLVEELESSASFVAISIDGMWSIAYAAVRDDSMENFVKSLKNRVEHIKSDNLPYPFIRAYKLNKIKLSPDVYSDDRVIRDFVRKYGVGSCFAIPLATNSGVFGVLVSVFDRKIPFSKKLYNLLNQIKEDLKAFLGNLRERRWNKIITIALNAGFSYVVIMDRFFRIVYMNEAALRLHGYTLGEVIGKRHSIFSSKQHDKEFLKRLALTLRKGEVFSDLFVYRTKDGRLIEGYTTIIPYKESGEVKYYIAVGKDITKEKELQKKLLFLSRHDLLTKLPNKDEFLRKVKLVLARDETKFSAFAVIDIHNCSYINQVYGYSFGDELIKETAKRLTQLLTGNDIVGRLAGDKFSLFMNSVDSEEEALVKLVNMLRILNRKIDLNGKSFSPSYHIGVSFYPVDGEDGDDLLAKAELALISSKAQGENEVGFFKRNTQERVFKIIKLKDELKKAYENNEFTLFYQPYYSIETREIAGAESLIRWIRDGKVISPSEFIEVLESSNLIFDVEERLIYEAVRTVASLKKKVPVSINISPKSFKRDYLVQLIKQALKDFNVDGRYITVEIIERVFIDDKNYTKNVIYQLKDMGVKVAVDDFGTGYSSLTYIRELPVDILKIDISFVKGMLKNKKDLSLVKLIVNIAKEFGFKTTAEGVESEEQVSILKDIGCDYVQGYLFCRPLPKDDFTKLLK